MFEIVIFVLIFMPLTNYIRQLTWLSKVKKILITGLTTGLIGYLYLYKVLEGKFFLLL